ncbi:MAG: MBL fold metallo-hydrolase [Chloroflexota bacterium]
MVQSTTTADAVQHAGDASLLFVGNATVLLRYAGFTLLTDPNFVPAGEEVPLGYGMKTRRLRDPALGIDQIPPVDAVILSHFHADHFDRIAEEQLPRDLPIVTTPEAAGLLGDRGFTAPVALETWQQHELSGEGGRIRITAMPGRHAPAGLSVALPDVMGSYLEMWPSAGESQPSVRLYITGDTIMYEGLREIPERCPEIDVALLHLGGTRVMGFTVTMDADQGVEMLELVRPRIGIPIHYDDYEAFKSPLSDFVEAVRAAGLDDRVRYVERGDSIRL